MLQARLRGAREVSVRGSGAGAPPLRISSARIEDYLGDRRRLVAGENFGLLVDDLREFASGAYWPGRAREYIESGPKGAGDFKNAPEFCRYNQWLYEAFAVE